MTMKTLTWMTSLGGWTAGDRLFGRRVQWQGGRMQLVAPLWVQCTHFVLLNPCALPACVSSYLLFMVLFNCNGHMGLIVWAECRGSKENAASSATGFNAPISYSLCFTWMRFLISAFYIWLLIAAVAWDWLFVRMHSYRTLSCFTWMWSHLVSQLQPFNHTCHNLLNVLRECTSCFESFEGGVQGECSW